MNDLIIILILLLLGGLALFSCIRSRKRGCGGGCGGCGGCGGSCSGGCGGCGSCGDAPCNTKPQKEQEPQD